MLLLSVFFWYEVWGERCEVLGMRLCKLLIPQTSYLKPHSLLKLLTGLANAAFTA